MLTHARPVGGVWIEPSSLVQDRAFFELHVKGVEVFHTKAAGTGGWRPHARSPIIAQSIHA